MGTALCSIEVVRYDGFITMTTIRLKMCECERANVLQCTKVDVKVLSVWAWKGQAPARRVAFILNSNQLSSLHLLPFLAIPNSDARLLVLDSLACDAYLSS